MEKYYEFPGVTWIYFWIDIDRRPFCGQQHCSSQERGQQIGFDGHKKTKGSKIHVAVTSQCLPIAIDLGPGNEHESRKLIPLLNDIQIKNYNGRPKSRPERIWADTKYHTFLVLTYLYNRRIRAQIKQRRNTKPKQGRPHVFLYREYTIGELEVVQKDSLDGSKALGASRRGMKDQYQRILGLFNQAA